jgi:hypothetical protein
MAGAMRKTMAGAMRGELQPVAAAAVGVTEV